MWLRHARPVAVALMTGSVLATAASGAALTITRSAAEANAVVAAVNGAPASDTACAALQPQSPPAAHAQSTRTPPSAPSATVSGGTAFGRSGTAGSDKHGSTPAARTSTATSKPASKPAARVPSRPAAHSPTAAHPAKHTSAPATTRTSVPAAKPSASKPASAGPTRAIKRSPEPSPATPTPKAGAKATPSVSPAAKGTQPGKATAEVAKIANLCIEVTRAQPSIARGHAAQWTVVAWTVGGTVEDVKVGLQANTAPADAPYFSFGCAHGDGTASCDLGQVDSRSAPRQLQARLTVPATASRVTSARLTATGAASQLSRAAVASVSVAVTASAPPKASPAPSRNRPRASATGTPHPTHAQIAPISTATQSPKGAKAAKVPRHAEQPQPQSSPTPVSSFAPLPVGSLPRIPTSGPTLRPTAGNAAGLFPTLRPSTGNTAGPLPTLHPTAGNAADLFPTLKPGPAPLRAAQTHARVDAHTSAVPESASIADAQLAGLAALFLAFILAVARVSIRSRPTEPPQTGEAPGKAETPDGPELGSRDRATSVPR